MRPQPGYGVPANDGLSVEGGIVTEKRARGVVARGGEPLPAGGEVMR